MARRFQGATDAVGSQQTVKSATASYALWTRRLGDGGSGKGRLWESGAGRLYHNADSASYTLEWEFQTATGGWRVARPAAGAWTFVGVAIDDSSAANDPIVWIGETKHTVGGGLTEVEAPAGAAPATHTGLTLGNNRADGTGDRVFDGELAEFAQWNVILTDAEWRALARGVSPLLIRPQARVEYIPMIRDVVSYARAAPTVQGGAAAVHPPIYQPTAGFAVPEPSDATVTATTNTRAADLDFAVMVPRALAADLDVAVMVPRAFAADLDVVVRHAPVLTPSLDFLVVDGGIVNPGLPGPRTRLSLDGYPIRRPGLEGGAGLGFTSPPWRIVRHPAENRRVLHPADPARVVVHPAEKSRVVVHAAENRTVRWPLEDRHEFLDDNPETP